MLDSHQPVYVTPYNVDLVRPKLAVEHRWHARSGHPKTPIQIRYNVDRAFTIGFRTSASVERAR
jgi:hypothetical protein